MEAKADLMGKNIVRIRRKNNMTQAELAKKLGVSQSAVNQWENGQRKAKLETVIKMSKVLFCNPKEIILEFDEDCDCLYSVNDVFNEINQRLENAKIEEEKAKETGRYQKASEMHGVFVELSNILEYFGQV